jgi:hypothetical protein
LPLTNDVYKAIEFGNSIAHNRTNVSLVWSGISAEDDLSKLPGRRHAWQRPEGQEDKSGWGTGITSPQEVPPWKTREVPSWLHRLLTLIFRDSRLS